MRFRVLLHVQGIIIRAHDRHGGRPAHAIVYYPEHLRKAACRRAVRERLRADLTHYPAH